MGTFRPKLEKTTVIFEISVFKFVEMQNFMLNIKKINLGPKFSYLGIFGLEFEKTIAIFEISIFESVNNEFLTIIVNFDKRSAFSKRPGSAFSGSGSGSALSSMSLISVN